MTDANQAVKSGGAGIGLDAAPNQAHDAAFTESWAQVNADHPAYRIFWASSVATLAL